MRIPSGVTDQGFYFVAVDATDYVTRETGLATWTVVRSRNGAADATMTTPTVTEIDNTTMPGVYFLLCDEDMTLAAGDQSQAMTYHITHAGMAPVTREIELYRPSVTAGETLTVSSGTGNAAVQSIANNAITTASINDGAFTAAKFASDFLTAAKVAADVGTEIATAVWASATRLLTAGTNIVLAKGTGITGFNDLSAAQVNAEADTALADYDGPTNAEMVARTLASADYATATNLQTVDDNVDAILVDTGTDIPASLVTIDSVVDAIKLSTDNLPSDPADASIIATATNAILTAVDDLPTNAELATALGTADDAVLTALTTIDGNVDDIKAKTDSLTFSQAGIVDAHIKYVAGEQVQGAGTAVDPWRPV